MTYKVIREDAYGVRTLELDSIVEMNNVYNRRMILLTSYQEKGLCTLGPHNIVNIQTTDYSLKIYTTLGYIVSLILLNLGHVFRFRIVSRMC